MTNADAVRLQGDPAVIRKEVAALVKLGAFPGDNETTEQEIDHRSDLLDAIPRPVTDEEAQALLRCFGPDSYYGVTWTLLHTIESAPNVPAISKEALARSEWLQMVWKGPRQ